MPTKTVTVRNNIIRWGFSFTIGSIKHKDAARGWTMGHNCYLEYGKDPNPVTPKRSTDIEDQAEFLSLDPNHRDYLRVPPDSPLGKSAAGGTWPSYIGAFPPGPAPQDGDWFTRLRQRWGEGVSAEKPLSPPVQITEPPPLAEWLKGRTVLTVSQDGKSQFKTIKAALDALKPHQVVNVLDRGPYRELLQGTLPDDTGLFSECQTVLECPAELDGKASDWGHMIGPLDGFRLSGLRLLSPRKKGGILFCKNTIGLVIEDFCITWTKPLEGTAPDYSTGLGFYFDENAPILKPIVVRNCLFDKAGLGFTGQTGRTPPLLVDTAITFTRRCSTQMGLLFELW